MIRAAAFDVGNILVDWMPERLPELFAAATGIDGAEAMQALVGLLARDKPRVEKGELTPRAFLTELAEAFAVRGGRKVPLDELRVLWCAPLRVRPGADALVSRLRREIAVAVWSNTDAVHFHHYSAKLALFARARSLWLSFLAGEAKPDRAFYEGALRSLGMKAGEVFFVDDTPGNVEGARALGIDAVQAASLEEVEAALAERGLLRGAG